MKTLFRAFARKQVRRARAAMLPALLALAMMGLAFTRLPSANTLWYETLTVTAEVGTGSFGCQPLSVTGGTVVENSGKSMYSYTLSGGGAGCKNISYVALPVCFNLQLSPSGLVLSTAQPATFSYAAQNGGSLGNRVKWKAEAGAGSGRFNATFSFTINGTNIPTVIVQAQTHPDVVPGSNPGGSTPTNSGAVEVPWPTSARGCESGTPIAGVGSTTGVGTYSSLPPASSTRTPRATAADAGGAVSGSSPGSGSPAATATPARPGATYNGTYVKP